VIAFRHREAAKRSLDVGLSPTLMSPSELWLCPDAGAALGVARDGVRVHAV
jgi:hypothetical protein